MNTVEPTLIRRIFILILPSLLCLLVVLPATYHVFSSPLFVGHDYTHVGRITEMVNTLRSGQFPPRWSQNLGFGYGMPLFSFYAPLPYYVGSLLVMLGISVPLSVALLFFLATWGASISMFYLTRNGTKQFLMPLISAALFTYLPYRAVDLFVRGALGELWGIWLLTVVICSGQNLVRHPTPQRLIMYAVTLGLFCLSHNLMLLMGLPFIAGILIIQLIEHKKSRIRIGKYIALGTIWGLGMAAYFLLPMFIEKNHTSVAALSTIDGGYSKHFVYWKQLLWSEFGYGGSIEGIYDGMSFALGIVGWLILALGLFAVVNTLIRSRKNKSVSNSLFWMTVILLCLFLTSMKSNFIWHSVELLSYLQFPWRFLSLILIALPLLFSSALNLIQNKRYKKIISAIILALLLFEVRNFKPNPETVGSTIASISDKEFITTELSKTMPDYIHPDLASIVFDSNKSLVPARTRFETSPPTNFSVQKDTASIAQAVIPPIDEPALIRANIFDFPGWQWKLDGIPVAHAKAANLPVMEYLASPSSRPQTLTVVWSETPLRQVSNGISMVSWIIAISYLVMRVITYLRNAIKPSQGKS